MNFLKKHKWLIFTVILTFLISLIFVYSGDDWQWGSTMLDLVAFSKNPYLNGRYLGNIVVIFLCKNIFIRGLIYTLVLNTIVYLVSKITKVHFLLVWLLLLFMPMGIFKEAIVWASGFANYVVSTMFLLLAIILLKKAYLKEVTNKLFLIVYALVFFLASLIIENLTVYLLILTLGLNIVYLVKNKKINIFLVISFIASLISTIIMFTHPSYALIASVGDGYRQFGLNIKDLLTIILSNGVNVIQYYMAFDNVVLICLISILLFIIYWKNKDEYQNKKQRLLILSFIYQGFYLGYVILSHFYPNWQLLLNYTPYFNMFITFIYMFILLLTIIMLRNKLNINSYFVLTIISIMGVLAPLFVVTPIGPRNFFMIYVLELMVVCNLLKQVNYPKYKIGKYIGIILGIIILVYYVSIYGYIYFVSEKRNNYIITKSQDTSLTNLVVPMLPYSNYVHNPDFDTEYYADCYKYFYNLRNDLNFEFISYDEWIGYQNKE